jgi:hypothetical protein
VQRRWAEEKVQQEQKRIAAETAKQERIAAQKADVASAPAFSLEAHATSAGW